MPESPEVQHLQGALADRYRIERELGRGGMATVYLAEDLKHHRHVAIKVLKKEIAVMLGPERFLREIDIAARLTHPHIPPLYDSGVADGYLYYVMPFLEGESLRDRLNREKQLPLEDALEITREVADALSYAHSLGIVHRDIKPENILFEADHAVVSDFGVARAITAAGGETLTGTGIAVGTPAYMSPEQATGSQEVDGRSDIYSLGCVLYEMLAGEPPFTGPTAESVLHQHLTGAPPRISAIRGAVPLRTQAAIERALAKTPADRFKTAGGLAEALGPATGGEHEAALARGRRARRVGALVTGVVAVGAMLAIVLDRAGPRVLPLASVIAVVPFAATTPDTALTRLGHDLVVTLSANLDGVGDIRTVDALTVLAQARERKTPYSAGDAADLARRLGASGVVRGTLIRLGTEVRLDLSLDRTDSAVAVARVSVVAAPDDLMALTDSATWALLREVWTVREPPTPSLEAVTTRSVPALRAFLEGERALVAGRWEPAAAAFAQAIAADSSFWLAYRRYTRARRWQFAPVDSAIVAAYRRNQAALPERERLLVEAELAPTTSARIARLREAAERSPDYWPAWMEYADNIIHDGPLVGMRAVDAPAALRQAVALNPGLVPAWTHLAWVYVLTGDTVGSAEALAALTRLGYTGGQSMESMPFLRALDRLARNGPEHAAAAIDSFVDHAANDPDLFWRRTWTFGFTYFGYPRAQLSLSRLVMARTSDADLSSQHRTAVAFAWAARGAWDSAFAAARTHLSMGPDPQATLETYGLRVVGEWLGVAGAPAAEEWRPAAARSARDGGPAVHSELAWLDGLAAATRRHRAGLQAAHQAIRGSGDDAAPLLARSLAALELELNGSREEAATALARLELERAEHPDDEVDDQHPFLTTVNRLAAAGWLVAEGDSVGAARLLTWYERPYLTWESRVSATLAGLAALQRARIEQGQGRSVAAARSYGNFLERYDMPVPSHQHLVEEARAALARLEGGGSRPELGIGREMRR